MKFNSHQSPALMRKKLYGARGSTIDRRGKRHYGLGGCYINDENQAARRA